MEQTSFILSIIASIGTLISIIFNLKLKEEIKSIKEIKGNKNIQSEGSNSINNTGDNNRF